MLLNILACIPLALVLFVAWSAIQGCWSGDHDWYTGPCSTNPAHMTCGSYGNTGPLPGEQSYTDHWPSTGEGITYRKERHCLRCDHKDYWDQDNKRWRPILTGGSGTPTSVTG
jgi:hypothetical protein